MPAPRFRYTRSEDGTSIAYTRFGSGPALVFVPPVPFSNVGAELEVPLMRPVYDTLATRFELVLYDGRGTGASERDVDDLSTAAQAADLGAVMDAAGLSDAALLATYLAVAPALTYAARHPTRVGHIVLFGAVVDGAEALGRPGTAALLGLIEEDWELFTQTAALDWMGWGAGDSGDRVARSFYSTTTPQIARGALRAYAASDLGPILQDVPAPTLVVHRRDGRQLRLAQSSELARRLPQGQLRILDGDSAALFMGHPSDAVQAISDFVRPGQAWPGLPSREAAVSLSKREQDVLRLIAAGESNQEIASALSISVHTVERHAANTYGKIGARGRADATGWALRHGLG